MARAPLTSLGCLLAFVLLFAQLGRSSDAGDSLRYVLDSDATTEERARALGRLAMRTAPSDPAMALVHAANGVRLAERGGDAMRLHEALGVQSELQARFGMVTEHVATTLRMVDLARSLGDAPLLSRDLQELSLAYRASDRMEQAIEHARQALAIAAATRNDTARIRAERFLMDALLRAGRHEELAKQIKHALEHADALPPLEQARLRLMMGKALLAVGRPMDALPYLVGAERAIAADGGIKDRFEAALAMAAYEAAAGRVAEGQRRLRQAEELSMHLPAAATRIPVLEARHALALAARDWQAAHGVLSTLQQVSDSMQRSSRDLALSGLLLVHELKSKEQDRSLLAERAERSEAQLLDQRASNRVLLAALALLVLLSALLFILARRYRLTARRNRLKSAVIERQKEELRARGLELQRQNMRLAETVMREERQGIALGEMHHRLKNNLQAIDALLQMQCGALRDPESERMLRDVQGRLRAMALVHQTIYRRGDDHALPLREHLEELARNILVAHGRHDRVSAVIDADEAHLDASDLLPLSLIVNELITNSLKHGIAPDAHGSVHLVLRMRGQGLELRYCDDGAPSRGDGLREGSFGLALLHALASQLNGTVRVQHGLQLTFSIDLAPESLPLRQAS